MRQARIAVLLAALIGVTGGAAHAQTPLSAIATSPDVTVTLGSSSISDVADDDVAIDDLVGGVTLESLGTLPEATDISGYEMLPGPIHLLCFDTVVELPGAVFAMPGDVVRFDGSTYSIQFDASANGVPDGIYCDAITIDSLGRLLISFDTDAALPGGVFVADEDLVLVDGPGILQPFFDGSLFGIPGEADLDGADLLSPSRLAVSLDVTATVAGVTAADEDILEVSSGGTWWLAVDQSSLDPDWEPADVDAIALPEPGAAALVSGAALLLMMTRRRRNRS